MVCILLTDFKFISKGYRLQISYSDCKFVLNEAINTKADYYVHWTLLRNYNYKEHFWACYGSFPFPVMLVLLMGF